MQTGEAAGWAAVLAKRQNTTPAALDADLLIRTLCDHHHFGSFFNDLEALADHPTLPAAQYFATRSFFTDYNARLNEKLSETERLRWEQAYRNQPRFAGPPTGDCPVLCQSSFRRCRGTIAR